MELCNEAAEVMLLLKGGKESKKTFLFGKNTIRVWQYLSVVFQTSSLNTNCDGVG